MMRVCVRGRRSGKTLRLLQLMANNPDIVMICINEQEAVRVEEEAERFFPSSRLEGRRWEGRFITFAQAREGNRGNLQRPAVIDNLDLMLNQIFGVGFSYEAVTLTGIIDPL